LRLAFLRGIEIIGESRWAIFDENKFPLGENKNEREN
jgi:hypothetical protein